MDIPTGRKPDFMPEPHQYRLADLQGIVTHPELQELDHINDYEAARILTSFVSLGHVAISRGDNEGYDEWMAYTTRFANRLQKDPSLADLGRHQSLIARLQFYGAINGRPDMADRLHTILAESSTLQPIKQIVELCAKHDINPSAWIERHLPDADQKDGAWTQFFSHKRIEAVTLGRDLTPEQWREPGSERVLRDILTGEIPEEGILNWGITAYRTAGSVQDKLRLIEQYGATVIRWTTLTADIPIYDKRAIYSFAAHVMADPEIPQATKTKLYDQATSWEDDLTTFDSFCHRGRLEIAKAIDTGQDVRAVFARLEKILEHEKNDAFRTSYMEILQISAAELYAAHGNFEQSARYLSLVNSFYDWQKKVEYFLRKGGNISMVRREDAARRDFEMAMQLDTAHETGMWDVRQLATDLLEHTMQTPDLQKARGTLLQLAEGMVMDGRKEMRMRYILLEQFAHRLLTSNPEMIEIGPELATHVGHGIEALPLYELFARHGSKEMEAAGWDCMAMLRTTDPVRCLSYHARMMLASHVLKPEPA